MFGRILIALIVIPIAELWLVAQIADRIDWLPTIAIVLAVSLIGAFLLRREGSGAWARVTDTLRAGSVPSNELADGALIIFGGTLLLTPGFITDLVGIAMLVPFTRAPVRKRLVQRTSSRVRVATTDYANARVGQFGQVFTQGGGASPSWPRTGPVVDVEDVEVKRTEPTALIDPELPPAER